MDGHNILISKELIKHKQDEDENRQKLFRSDCINMEKYPVQTLNKQRFWMHCQILNWTSFRIVILFFS